jgi:hypothetical protein
MIKSQVHVSLSRAFFSALKESTLLSQSPVQLQPLNPQPYRGTSLIRKRPPLGPCSRHMPRALWWFQGGGGFL